MDFGIGFEVLYRKEASCPFFFPFSGRKAFGNEAFVNDSLHDTISQRLKNSIFAEAENIYHRASSQHGSPFIFS